MGHTELSIFVLRLIKQPHFLHCLVADISSGHETHTVNLAEAISSVVLSSELSMCQGLDSPKFCLYFSQGVSSAIRTTQPAEQIQYRYRPTQEEHQLRRV